MTGDQRLLELTAWLHRQLGASVSLRPASADASFRRYFRVFGADQTWIAMDAPPAREDCRPFIAVARAMHRAGLHVPRVLAQNLSDGFLLLDDLGDRQYLRELQASNVEQLYGDALQALLHLQAATPMHRELPPYDAHLLKNELSLFTDWYLGRHLALRLSGPEADTVEQAMALLIRAALEQPLVWVHRDYHSRNLMLVSDNNPGILDFQDAVLGPITYDLVSLLRDCYIQWPDARVRRWALAYRLRLQDARLLGDAVAEDTFLRWFDLMGAQRHLKAIGIFARLWHRDGKPGFLSDIPRTFAYLLAETRDYPELARFHELLRNRVAPRLEQI